MTFTETLLSDIVFKIKGTHSIELIGEDKTKKIIDFKPPFKVIKVVDELEKILGVKFP